MDIVVQCGKYTVTALAAVNATTTLVGLLPFLYTAIFESNHGQ